ncbi:MAG: hypothetical protein JNL21_01905 [Myxococcales bacterium]|nr:hypothetical protein [Myxococcales bacterium]
MRDALIASAELLGGFLSSIGEPAVGRPIGSAANTTSLTRRWLKYHREGGGSVALREAIIRTPGTPARMYGAIRALLW